MNKVIFSVIFAILVTFAPTVKASIASNKSFSVNLPDGGDKKKKKDKSGKCCESKKECTSSEKKSCCSKGDTKTEEKK